MATDFSKQQIEAFVKDLNSAKPMPGGGSAAAICGSMAAALAGMSAHMTAGKKKYAAVEDKMQQIMTATKLLQEEMLAMSQEDADMYSLVLQAYKLPKDTEEEAAQRAKAIEEASKTAVVASLKVTGACIPESNGRLRPDHEAGLYYRDGREPDDGDGRFGFGVAGPGLSAGGGL